MLFLYDGKLNELDLIIAKKIEANPKIISDNNIFEAAEVLGISASKLTKFCQKIQLEGFKEIKFKIDDEIKHKQYIDQHINNVDIKSLIHQEYHNRIGDLERLLLTTNKIIIISDRNNHQLANFVTSELRSSLHIDVVNYSCNEDFSFEYLTPKPLTIFLDEEGEIDLFSIAWYRSGNKYLHLTNNILVPRENYYPISLDNSQINYSFQIKIVMILSWIKNKKKACN